jgi:hypothetical protein
MFDVGSLGLSSEIIFFISSKIMIRAGIIMIKANPKGFLAKSTA